jgi:hypothetical protein
MSFRAFPWLLGGSVALGCALGPGIDVPARGDAADGGFESADDLSGDGSPGASEDGFGDDFVDTPAPGEAGAGGGAPTGGGSSIGGGTAGAAGASVLP